jgi:hypothetical protein
METHNIVLLLRGGAVKVCIAALCMAASGYKIILFHKMPRDIKAGIMRMRARRDFYANRWLPRSTHSERSADRFNFARRRQSILPLSMGNSHDREREQQHDLSRLERRHLPLHARNKRAGCFSLKETLAEAYIMAPSSTLMGFTRAKLVQPMCVCICC